MPVQGHLIVGCTERGGEMLQAHAYDHQRGKTIYVEEAQRRAEVARLLHEAGLAQEGWFSPLARSLVCWMASWSGRLVAGLNRWLAQDIVPSSLAFDARSWDCS
jgi:hypothetical protein